MAQIAQTGGWQQIGPGPIQDLGTGQLKNGTLSGMVTDIAIDPTGTVDTTLFIATDAGGVWKSIDGGQSWTAKSDFMPSLAIGSVVIDPGNPQTVYAGSGNQANPGDSSGAGIYKSTDGGETWIVLNPNNVLTGQAVNRMVMPESNTLLAATTAGLFHVSGGGTTWTQVISGGTVTDLKLDPAARSVVYAFVAGTGILRSTNSGASFQPFFSAASPGMRPGLAFGGGVLAQSTRPDSRTFYAAAILTSGAPATVCAVLGNPSVGLFRSTDGGASWSDILQGPELPGQSQSAGFFAYNLTLGVDPFNANVFYYGLKGLYSASDGGASGLRDATNPGQGNPCPPTQNNRVDNGAGFGFGHSDHHAMAFSPHATGAPARAYFGNDGGLITSPDGGKTITYLNSGLATVLINQNGFDIGHGGRGNEAFSYGTAQDNGVFAHRRGQSGIAWLEAADGDGGSVAVDPLNAAHAIATDNSTSYTTTDGQNWTASGQLPGSASPIVFDPFGTRVYAYSGGTLLRSIDNGATFTSIGAFPQGVSAIAPARSNSDVLWLGLGDKTIQVSANARASAPGFAATPSQPANAPGGLSALAVDPTDARVAVSVFSGFSGIAAQTQPSRHVFMTKDSGAHWSDISGSPNGGLSNLPDLPVYSVVIDPGQFPHTIIVAGDGGVFQTADQGGSWQKLGTGLPNAQMLALALNTGARPEILRVASWGRSAFELRLPSAVATGDPVMLQGNWGSHGNFELLVPNGMFVDEFARDLDDPARPWLYLRSFGVETPTILGPIPIGLTFIQSSFKGDGVHGNFEVVVRGRPPVVGQGTDALDFWWMDSRTAQWNGPFPIMADGQPIDHVTGNPVMLQGNWGDPANGNFELLVPRGQFVSEYVRNNQDPALAWHFLRNISYPVPINGAGPVPVGVSFIQSTFKGDGVHGNFEAVVRVHPLPLTGQSDHLDFWWLDSRTGQWNAGGQIMADGKPIDNVTGDPVLIQGDWGNPGNFEMLVPRAGGVVAEYFRDNQDFSWHFLRNINYARTGQLGSEPVGVSFVQSSFKSDGVHGNFEAIVHTRWPPIFGLPDGIDEWSLSSGQPAWSGRLPVISE
jgi:photosystem II stability/assembly factor-like uncharacterized protein